MQILPLNHTRTPVDKKESPDTGTDRWNNSGSATGDQTQGLWYCAPALKPQSYNATAANRAEPLIHKPLSMSINVFLSTGRLVWLNKCIYPVSISHSSYQYGTKRWQRIIHTNIVTNEDNVQWIQKMYAITTPYNTYK